MEANEKKRNEYLEQIKNYDKTKLVYIDESGIEMNICKDRGWGQKGKLLLAQVLTKVYKSGTINK